MSSLPSARNAECRSKAGAENWPTTESCLATGTEILGVGVIEAGRPPLRPPPPPPPPRPTLILFLGFTPGSLRASPELRSLEMTEGEAAGAGRGSGTPWMLQCWAVGQTSVYFHPQAALLPPHPPTPPPSPPPQQQITPINKKQATQNTWHCTPGVQGYTAHQPLWHLPPFPFPLIPHPHQMTPSTTTVTPELRHRTLGVCPTSLCRPPPPQH